MFLGKIFRRSTSKYVQYSDPKEERYVAAPNQQVESQPKSAEEEEEEEEIGGDGATWWCLLQIGVKIFKT
jgi:hypothetical protein